MPPPGRRQVQAIALWVASTCLIGAASALAGEAVPTAADPVLEARVMSLAAELRCLVCQNQSLADSHADLAIDLKNQVREQLKAGSTEGQVIAYMTERYGDFVLYRPPLKRLTLLLWGGPALLLMAGAALLWAALGRYARPTTRAMLIANADTALLYPLDAVGAQPPGGGDGPDEPTRIAALQPHDSLSRTAANRRESATPIKHPAHPPNLNTR